MTWTPCSHDSKRLEFQLSVSFLILRPMAYQEGQPGKGGRRVGEYTSQSVISKLPPAARGHNLSLDLTQFQLPSHLTVLPAPEI